MAQRPEPTALSALVEQLPIAEVAARMARVRRHLERFNPEAAGLLVFSRLNLYYFTGSPGGGVLWIPRLGEPVLALRRALRRAHDESPLARIVRFRSFGELPDLARDAGSPWPAPGETLAVEMNGLTWALSELFRERLGQWRFVNGDAAVARTRAVKSAWELAKLRRAGELHARALDTLLPERIRPGMSERDIAWTLWTIYGELGHAGPMRMQTPGDEIFLGHVSAGESGNYSGHFNGPLGLLGEHPALPVAGSPRMTWSEGQLLGVDTGFSVDGYQTDKTRFYFAGRAADLPAAVRKKHDAALAIIREAAEALRPGARPSDLYRAARERAKVLGVAEGFMGLGEDKPPFLGHGIGLAVDEWPALAERFDEPLEENMILALEPKIGIPGIGMVGAEETYRVTPTGGEVLTGGPGGIVAVSGEQ